MSNIVSPKFWVIIPAAGIGTRMQSDKPKQYLQIENKTILEHSISCFLSHPSFEQVFIGLSAQDTLFERYGLNKIPGVEVFQGGQERADTVLSGLAFLSRRAKAGDWIWVHDAARPCLSKEEIDLLINSLERDASGVVLGVPVKDTLKRVYESQDQHCMPLVQETQDRSNLWRAMTPQIFKYSDLSAALAFCRENNITVTDEASAIERMGWQMSMVHGSEQNIKVTVPADLITVQACLAKKQSEQTLRKNTMQYPRIGTGFDVHAFGEGSFIILGGVKIPYEKGLIAHSDGDVLLHAIMDAMLGALALGDIGKHFPDTDEKWKGANSRTLLKAVKDLLGNQGYQLGNIDCTIIAQAPKMAPHISKMQANLAEDLQIEPDCIGVKATTTEKLGFTGRKEGIACQASVILVPLLSGKDL